MIKTELNVEALNETIRIAKDHGTDIGKLSDGYYTFDELYELAELKNPNSKYENQNTILS